MHFKYFLFTLLGFSFLFMPSASANKRIALVIGNGEYKKVSPLLNPVNDARDIARTLRTLDFEVIEKHNLNRKQMAKAIHQFGNKLAKGTVGLFYYAGHGLQIAGKNYLLPLGSRIDSKDEVPYESINVDRVLSKMESAGNGLNIMILDACRNNPFKGRGGFRDLDRGLARVNAPTGSLVIYATAPGEKAADGQGKNGLFTKHLLKNMVRPQVDVEIMLRDTRLEVMQEAKRLGYQQVPWSASSLVNQFCFAGCGQGTPPPVISSQPTLEVPSETVVQTETHRSFEPEMVLIKGGRFQMGCVSGKGCRDNEKPAHTVKVDTFYMGKTELTFAQWDACVDAGGCSHKPSDEGWGRGQRPVINVSWNNIQQYIQWLSKATGKAYRLPNEAEWEYAARAGTTTAYPWGNQIDCSLANYGYYGKCKKTERTKPVASFKAYGGLYDMQGNVWEWTCSAYTKQYEGAENRCTTAKGTKRVLRSGSWRLYDWYVRSAYRDIYTPVKSNDSIGFRLSLNQPL